MIASTQTYQLSFSRVRARWIWATTHTLLTLVFSLSPANLKAIDTEVIDKFLVEHLREVPVPGFSVVIVSGNEIVYQRGFGVEQALENKAMTPQSSVAIGSLAKSFTAVAIMRLVEEGRVELAAPITRYLPWLRLADGRQGEITIQHLLSNASGIASLDRWLFNLSPSEEAMKQSALALSSQSLAREPGRSFEYCNENWILLGLVIAEVSGQPYSEYIQTELLQPLEMARSTTSRNRLAELKPTSGHYCAVTEMRVASLPFLGEALPAGSAMRASAQDLGSYLIMLLNGGKYQDTRILRQETVAEIFKPRIQFRIDMPEMGLQGEHASYAAGWIVADIDGREVVHHGGDAIVMGSWTMLDLEKKLAASVLYNGPRLDAYRFPSKLWLVNNLLHLANDEPVSEFGLATESDPFASDFTLPDNELHRYAGDYISANGLRFKIVHSESRLFAAFESGVLREELELDFLSRSAVAFRNLTGAKTANFILTEGGEVTGIVGGLPGGRFRKIEDTNTEGRLRHVAPDKSIEFRLAKGWEVRWEGNTFEAASSGEDGFLLGGRNLNIEPRWRNTSTRKFVTETISGRSWRKTVWHDADAQYLLLTTEDSQGPFSLFLHVPHGRLTGAIRDLTLPLLAELDLKSTTFSD